MKIPVLRLKDVLDALLSWARDDYLHYKDLGTPEQSWVYATFNGNTYGNFDYYDNVVELISRGDESPVKLETRLMFDTSRASMPTIHIHFPGESKGMFTPMNEFAGFGDWDGGSNVYREHSSSSMAVYELIITGANSEEVVLIYELLYALFLAGHDTLQNYFETFQYSGTELMANPDIIPYNTFYRSFKITVGQERTVRSIVLNPIVNNLFFSGNAVNFENQEAMDWLITNLKSESTGGEIPDADYNAFKAFFAGLVDKSVKSFIRGLVSWVNSLAVRVGLLEDKYILKYVVPTDVVSVILTQDKYGQPFNFQEGEEIEISFKVKPFPGEVNSRIAMIINNLQTVNYDWSTSYGLVNIPTARTFYYGQSTFVKIKILAGELNGYFVTMPYTSATTLEATHSYGISSHDLNLNAISSIKLWSQVTQLPAGFTVLVKKL